MSARDDRRPPTPDELERQAWTWLRRLGSGDVTSWDADAFKRWLHTSPAHQSAFSAAKREWALIRPAAREVLHGNPEASRQHARALQGPSVGRRAFLGAAVSAAAVTGFAVFHPPAGLWPAPRRGARTFVRRPASSARFRSHRPSASRSTRIPAFAGKRRVTRPSAFACCRGRLRWTLPRAPRPLL